MRGIHSFALPLQQDAALESLIRANSTIRTVPAKQVLLDAGESPEGVYYILNGRTRHYMLGEDGSEKILFILANGWFFSEGSCILHRPLQMYVITEEKTDLCFIPMERFEALLAGEPSFNAALMDCFARKTLILCNEIENLTFFSAKDRLLQFFYSNADPAFDFDDRWYPLKHNYTQQELATILGVSRVSISKFINEFCNDGIIRIVNRRIQLNIRNYNELDKRFNDSVF